MKTYAIEEGEFVTDGATDEHGKVVGELTNHRGTRRWLVDPSEIAETPVVVPPEAAVVPHDLEHPTTTNEIREALEEKPHGRRLRR